MKNELIEDWQFCPFKENPQLFVVSDRGRIGELLKSGECGILRDIDDEGLALKYNDDKYVTIWLCNVKCYAHVLVARAFLPNPMKLPQVNHIDHNTRNNCVTNLEFISNRYNQQLRSWFHRTKFNRKTLRWELKSGKLEIK